MAKLAIFTLGTFVICVLHTVYSTCETGSMLDGGSPVNNPSVCIGFAEVAYLGLDISALL